MSPAIEREKQIFSECLALSPSERARRLDESCGDDTHLRQRLDRLLLAHDTAEQSSDSLASTAVDLIRDSVPNYELIRVIEAGGMGIVWEALQISPLQRRVALKTVVRPACKSFVERFRAEQQLLAAMDHPYIAKIYDAGQTALAVPYFTMELIDGVPLPDFLQANKLDLNERLRLFIKVCQGVQHAHQKGVIHRDLKPSNVLIATGADGSPEPKIIDFGIARFITPEKNAVLTLGGQMLGTPAYMSPEQARADGTASDTRSDIYALGAILYELITGLLPLDPGDSHLDFLLKLRSGELRIDPPGVRSGKPIARDLEAVVLKAVEQDPERRYGTALALAEDVERYLRSEPVLAHPPTVAYRASRFIRRHRKAVATASIVAIAILAGAVMAGVGYMRAARAEDAARREAATAEKVSEFLTRLFSASDPNAAPGAPRTVEAVLDQGASRVEQELRDDPAVQARLLGTLGHVYESLGMYPRSRALSERSLALAADKMDLHNADVLISLARVRQRQGDFNGALAALEQALKIRTTALGPEDVKLSEVFTNMGAVYGQLSQLDKAEAMHRRALDIAVRNVGPDHHFTYNSWRGLGIVQERKGDLQASLASFARLEPIAVRRYGAMHPITADAIHQQAVSLYKLNRFHEAAALHSRALDIQRRTLGADHPNVAFTAVGLSQALRGQGKLQEALPPALEALHIREKRLGAKNVRTAEALQNLGQVYLALGRRKEALPLFERAVSIYQQAYGPSHPETSKAQELLITLASQPSETKERQR